MTHVRDGSDESGMPTCDPPQDEECASHAGRIEEVEEFSSAAFHTAFQGVPVGLCGCRRSVENVEPVFDID